MHEFQLMMAAGDQLPDHLKYWTTWMQIILFVGPVIFIKYKPARWLLIAQLGNILIAYLVFLAEGLNVTKLFGVGHILWLVPLWMLTKDILSDKSLAYRIFALLAIATICISLIFDFRDTILWLMGERGSILLK